MVVLWVVLEGLLGTNFSRKIVVPNAGCTSYSIKIVVPNAGGTIG